MSERPALTSGLKSKDFLEYYYLKEELVQFCRDNGLPASGGKQELTERIATFLDTGKIKETSSRSPVRSGKKITEITADSIIEENIVCSEIHRAFFKSEIGESFSFNVAFQRWLKANAGKTYSDAVDAYYEIKRNKDKGPKVIGKQFEYNTYIRDFFEDNKWASLDDAIRCWKYKKSLKGHNKYERSDLEVLSDR
jgi:hypothetical protein